MRVDDCPWRFLHDAGRAGINNLKVIDADALEILAAMPDNSIDRLQLYFPDPWQKKRHHKRRFVVAERIALVEQKIASGGWFHAATDWEHYAFWMLDVLDQRMVLENMSGKAAFTQRPDWRPMTKFEARGIAQGHGVWDVIYQKK